MNTAQVPGRVHTQNFTLLFCSNPNCWNTCELTGPEQDLVRSTTTFRCRECNPPGYGLPAGFRSWIQFEHWFKHGQPVDTDHIKNQGSDTQSERLQGPIDADVSTEWEENPGTSGDKKFLLRYFDKTDSMITHGQPLKKRMVERGCPEWMLDILQVREFILNTYPLAGTQRCPVCRHTECIKVRTQKSRAGVWYGVIYLHHLQGLPASEVAEELKISEARVEKTVLTINRHKAGLTASGKQPSRRGRPRAVPLS